MPLLSRTLFLLAAMSLMPLLGCSNSYSAKEIEAWVVDAETGAPVEGVNVVAYWELEFGLEGGSAYEMEILETVTAKNGRFYFPAWGPKEIPSGLPSEARLKDRDPSIVLFKSGYEGKTVGNNRPIMSMSGHGESVRTSEWNGKKIQFKRFKGRADEYAIEIAAQMSSLHFIEIGRACEWTHLPKMIAAIASDIQKLSDQKLGIVYLPMDLIGNLPRQLECGNARKFFQGALR